MKASCAACGNPTKYLKNSPAGRRGRRLCWRCKAKKAPISKMSLFVAPAYRMVYIAVQYGMLPRLDGSIMCADCGSPATQYEHRDYSKPLDVRPVCRPCNVKAGPARLATREECERIADERRQQRWS